MIPQNGTILCVESDHHSGAAKCEVLSVAGYTAVSACPSKALTILTNRIFNLIVATGLTEVELMQICNVAQGAEILSLREDTVPTLLLFFVDERLRQLRLKAN
jgi:hypothetical protein